MSVSAEPSARVSRGWTVRFALLWFGFWMANLAPVQLVLPNQFDALDHAHKVRDFGMVSGVTGVAALFALPLFGALCDRTRSRFGRRRVWMLAGTVVFAVGLLATGLQSTWVGGRRRLAVRHARHQHGHRRARRRRSPTRCPTSSAARSPRRSTARRPWASSSASAC